MATKPTFMEALNTRTQQNEERDATPRDNVTITEEGSEIVIRFDKRGNFGPSKSGKTNIVASTSGFVDVGGIGISLNATRKA